MKIKSSFIVHVNNFFLLRSQMDNSQTYMEMLNEGDKLYHPGFSIDCVIFGFHNHELKVLLLKMKYADKWALPGGFVLKDENVEDAAVRILQARTGLEHIFLKQFYLFGNTTRSDSAGNREFLQRLGVTHDKDHWLLQRFITVGYYALVNFADTIPRPDPLSDACEWKDLQDATSLAHDHNHILDKALETLRQELRYQPVGYNLLPEKFTMRELQKLYETILGRQLDRRNFMRKVLSYGILKKTGEVRTGAAHTAPQLYSFDLARYEQALAEGLQKVW
jgi:8-oxo-dGTP diphosphatase